MAKKIEIILDVDGKPIDVAIDATLNLKQQYRELLKEINKSGQSAENIQVLSTKLGDVKDQLESTSARSKDLFGSLSLLPGPVGAFAGTVDSAIGSLKLFSSFSFKDLNFQLGETLNDFKDIASNIGKATGITKIYTTLNNALAGSFVKVGVGEAAAATGARAFAAALTATGIGALIVGLGMAVSALMDYANAADTAAEKQKELNDAADKMAKETLDVESQSVKRQGDLLLASEKARGASAKRIYEIEQQNRQLLLSAQQRYYNSLTSIDSEEGRKTLQTIKNTQNEIKVAEQNFKAEQLKENQAKNDKLQQQNKTKNEKIAADNKSADDMLLDLQRENDALAIQDERKRQDKELENQKKAEEDKIKSLEISSEKRAKLLEQINTKYAAKQRDVDNKRKEEDLKAEEEFNDKVAEIRISAIQNEFERTQAERRRKYAKDLEDLEKDKEFIKKSESEKAQIRKDLKAAFDNDINKMDLEDKLRKAAIQKGDDDARYNRLVTGAQFDLDLQRRLLEQKKAADDKYYSEQLAKEGLTADQIRELNERKLADQILYTEKSNEIERNRVAVKQKALDDIISIAGAETDVGRAALIAKQILMAKELVMEIKRTITFSTQAAARSTVAVAEGTAQTAKVGFPQNIPLLIGYAAQAAAIISAIVSAVKSAKSAANADTGGGAGESGAPNLGRNYGEGGMINGPRHAQGGVLINAEGGEAVMTRGAVTMFAPLLSALNQAGGGTSFSSAATGGARPDNPSVENPAISQQPMIMKTYVVSNELTTEAEKQARLKDLSTL